MQLEGVFLYLLLPVLSQVSPVQHYPIVLFQDLFMLNNIPRLGLRTDNMENDIILPIVRISIPV